MLSFLGVSLIFVRLNSGSHDCCFVVVVCCLLVCCFVFVVWARTTKNNTAENNKTPCFVVYLQVFGHRKANNPMPSTKNIFNFFVRKGSFLQKEAFGFVLLTFLVFLVVFCLISRSHFEHRFRDHKTARSLFKLVLRV